MGYVRNTYGCHCYYGDSAFKRYNRASIGDTVIFNYNSNNRFGCCGGHGGSFWNGLGLGVGMGFGNMLGGLLGGFGNMFGGFGMCNMFGGFGNMFGGFPSWGGFGMPSWFGFGGTPSSTTTGAASTASTPSSTVKTVTVEKPQPDADIDGITALSQEVGNLIQKIKSNPNEVTQDEIDALKNKINDRLNGSFDGVDDEADKKLLSAELQKLDNLVLNKPEKSDLDGILDKINGNNNLTDDDISNLISGFDKLTDEQKKALKDKLVPQLNSYKVENSSDYKIPRTYSDLLKMELLCKLDSSINVRVEKYANATDKWIKGPIQNVTKNGNNISYWVNCESTGLEIKAQWRFTTQENSDTAKITGTIANENKYTARIGMTYNYDTTEGVYINNNNKVTGTTR